MQSLDNNSVDSLFSTDQDLEFTLSTSSPTPSCTSLSKKFDRRRLRFEIILEAATAVTPKSEESAITYLNRGQLYGIQIKDKDAADEIITSTLSIDFHAASYRVISESYWKYWVSQQKHPDPRAIDIDTSRSSGISDLNFPSFDKISFNWNGKEGCKIFVRFKCLSTDFSRIKGVKGIPLRAHMDSFIEGSSSNESCFCKVKLFRDKGAERKNKDDHKQIARHLEKVYGKATEESLPLMYNASIPYSVFGEIPIPSTIDTFEHAIDDFTPPVILSKKLTRQQHKRIMTAPKSCIKKSKSSPDLSDRSFDDYTPESMAHPSNNTFDLEPPPAVIDTTTSSDCLLLDELFPAEDMLYGTTTMPMDYGFIQTPDLVSDTTYLAAQPTPSIYDVFTPEELQQPENVIVSYPRQDYFCAAYSVVQQKLEIHNKTATSIILNSSQMMQLSTKRAHENSCLSRKKHRSSQM